MGRKGQTLLALLCPAVGWGLPGNVWSQRKCFGRSQRHSSWNVSGPRTPHRWMASSFFEGKSGPCTAKASMVTECLRWCWDVNLKLAQALLPPPRRPNVGGTSLTSAATSRLSQFSSVWPPLPTINLLTSVNCFLAIKPPLVLEFPITISFYESSNSLNLRGRGVGRWT